MGCLVSKPEEADRDAFQRNARIDRTIKNDKKTLDRTIKILLLGGWFSVDCRLTAVSRY